MNSSHLRDLKSVYLIVGTAIGTGILALPISTAQSGFLFSSLGLLICWLFMTLAAFFMMEARLYFKNECDLDYMSEHTVGPKLEFFTKISYLVLLFSLMAAYILVGSSWMVEFIKSCFDYELNKTLSMILFTLASAIIITQGIRIVGKANHVVTVVLLISFAFIILLSINHIDCENLKEVGDLKSISSTMPLILTSFGFSIVIPTIVSYQDNDSKRTGESLIIGSIMILFAYFVWQLIAFGIIGKSGEDGLVSFLSSKEQSTEIVRALGQVVHNSYLLKTARTFVIFAVISSLLGVGMALYHFMLDAVKIQETTFKITTSTVFTFIPPLALLIFYPAGIVEVLNFAGIFVAIILGIIPCIMIWYGRYIKKLKTSYTCFGGKPLIIITALFFIYVIIQEIINLFF